MMNMVKKLFKDDRVLSRLSAQLGSLRQQLNLVKWSGLFPPALRDKDRFLRTFIIAKWADRIELPTLLFYLSLHPAAAPYHEEKGAAAGCRER
jgi:hypothetical protein